MTSSPTTAQLVLANDPRKVAPLDPNHSLTIGTAAANQLCLASAEGVSTHHAVVRFSSRSGWVVCDWQSRDGTFLEGHRVRQCRPLRDGDQIKLGLQGPVLLFKLLKAAEVPRAQTPASQAHAAQSPRTVDFQGQNVVLKEILNASVQSLPHHPHIFSWWLLVCLGGLLLLPFPMLFWPLQIGALATSILLGSRNDHSLVLVLRNGHALRHNFANRRTAIAHRNGIRQASGEGPNPG